MLSKEEVKKIVNSLYKYEGEDFSDQRIQFGFVRDLKAVLMTLEMNGFYVYMDRNIFGPNCIFSGVTFEDSNDIPTYTYRRF